MNRLNSGIFGIFYPDQFYSNVDGRVKSALKIIQNVTDIAYEQFVMNSRIFRTKIDILTFAWAKP